MSNDRLGPLDASFLHLEDASSHMHVAAALLFKGRPPGYQDLLAHIESRLRLVPRYRQRLAEVPLAQARPRWVDDERFDLRYHVRHTGLPEPGTEYELQLLAGRVFSQQLRRDRPLWEMWLVSGLEGGRFAILSKTHHALVDGVSGLDILSVLLAPDSEEHGKPWRARPAPSTVGLVAEALIERATSAGELARPLRAAVRRPRQALGGTVNDVVLTVVTLALRRHLRRRGEDVAELELKAFVPVSVRTEGVAPGHAPAFHQPGRDQRAGAAVPAAPRRSRADRHVPDGAARLHLNLGIAIVSYNGTLNFGLNGDFNALHDLEDLAEDFLAGLGELADAAGIDATPAAAAPGHEGPRPERG